MECKRRLYESLTLRLSMQVLEASEKTTMERSYEKSPDCLESLRDLQRYLRRDNPETRDVFLELGKWNVVQQDLVPLIKRYSDDFEIVLNCVKVLVFLTMPVDPTSHQVSKQVEYLQLFKAGIVEGDAIAVIVSHLVRDEDKRLTIVSLHVFPDL